MVDLCEEIAKANEFEIAELVQAAIKRYNELFPDWEIGTVSIQKSDDKSKQLDQMITMLQQLKERT